MNAAQLEKIVVNALEDIKGKRVSVGAPGGGDQILTNLILAAAGIEVTDTPDGASWALNSKEH